MNEYYDNTWLVSPKNFLKLMTIIHLALFMGQVIFAAVVVFLVNNGSFHSKAGNDSLFYLAPFISALSIFIGSFLFRKLMNRVKVIEILNKKFAFYLVASIARYAFAESVSLFCIVCYLLSANYIYLGILMVNVLYFIIIRPNKFKMLDDLKLTIEESADMDFNNL